MNSKRMFSFLLAAVVVIAARDATAMCGDVTGDGAVSSSDALSVLRAAVGHGPPMMCEPCDTTTTTTTLGASTTTLGGGSTTTTVTGGTLFTLTVGASGMHGGFSGRVTSDPAGIQCGNDCTETYEAGTGVTLTAIEDSYWSDFVGWRGDVPDSCLYNDDPCTVTMDRDLEVWAMFRGGMMGR